MEICILMDERVCPHEVSALDFLELSDDREEIRDWLMSDVWPVDELSRLAIELGDILLAADGHIDECDYEALQFVIDVFPELESLTVFDLMAEALEEGVEINPESFAEFLCWLHRDEVSILPGDDDRTFEYALAAGPLDALECFLGISDEGTTHEVLINLARTGYYRRLGDYYFEAVANLAKTPETSVQVMQILSDRVDDLTCELEDTDDLLGEAQDLVISACNKAGIDVEALFNEDCGCGHEEETADADSLNAENVTGGGVAATADIPAEKTGGEVVENVGGPPD